MFKVDIPVNMREQQAIQRRRDAENERKSRIFNPRQRILGVDEPSLRIQVSERKEREQMENDVHEAIAAEMVRHDEICCLLELRVNRDLFRANQDLNDFRLRQQHKATRKEWDLSDPLAKFNDLPARVSDTDERCGVSGMQKFAGEDLDQSERKKLQTKQFKSWLNQQVEDKRRATQDLQTAQRLYMLRQAEIEKRIMNLEALRLQTVRENRMAQNEYNRRIDNMRKAREQQALEDENREKQAELANNIHGDFLTENASMARSCLGAHRVRVDYWKGMNERQILAIREHQETQRRENAEKREQEAARAKVASEVALATDRIAVIMERQVERQRRQHQMGLVKTNEALGKEQLKRNKQRLINEHGAEYFAQFNTSSR